MSLSDNLKRIRKDNNLSQEQLAEKLGVSRQAVSKWESNQSYPEMDKVLLICKIFDYNINELMNENVKEVDDTKQSKNNFNKYVEEFFEFITKVVGMLSCMSFKQKIKCFVEQIFTCIFIVIIFAIIGAIGEYAVSSIFGVFPMHIYHSIYHVLASVYIILCAFIGIAVFIHIFKIRYLDYYEIAKAENVNSEEKISNDENNLSDNVKEPKKVFIKEEKEKIIIRDPEHMQFKFLSGIIKFVLLCIKIFVAFFAIYFAFILIGLATCLILSFLFIKTGLLFLGALFGIISAMSINLIILEILYNFIVNRKNKKLRMAITFVISLILAGASIGFIIIGATKFNYIDNPQENNEIEDLYTVQMTDNLSINTFGINLKYEYVEENSKEIKIKVNHSKYSTVSTYYDKQNEGFEIYCSLDDRKVMELLRDCIDDINDKQIKDYSKYTVTIYTSKENIDKLIENENTKISNSLKSQINTLNLKNEKKEDEILQLNETINEQEEMINDLKEQLDEKDEIILNR